MRGRRPGMPVKDGQSSQSPHSRRNDAHDTTALNTDELRHRVSGPESGACDRDSQPSAMSWEFAHDIELLRHLFTDSNCSDAPRGWAWPAVRLGKLGGRPRPPSAPTACRRPGGPPGTSGLSACGPARTTRTTCPPRRVRARGAIPRPAPARAPPGPCPRRTAPPARGCGRVLLLGHPAPRCPRGLLLRFRVEELRPQVGHGEVAAGRHGVHQPGHDRVRVVGVRYHVQDREQRHRHRLGEVKQLARPGRGSWRCRAGRRRCTRWRPPRGWSAGRGRARARPGRSPRTPPGSPARSPGRPGGCCPPSGCRCRCRGTAVSPPRAAR